MAFDDLGAWLDVGPDSDVVVSSRVRIARNMACFPFVNRATQGQCQEIVALTRQALAECDLGNQPTNEMIWVDLDQASDRERMLLVERHLISRHHAETRASKAVAVARDESMSLMVNEEDHLRLQVLTAGLQFDQAFDRICQVEQGLESSLEYAFSPRWGYLTACPTNVGTGARFSVMMHLPGLLITREIERVKRSAKDLHLAVRGHYGEGSESTGDLFQISNQITLGQSEDELMAEFQQRVIPRIIDYERQARQMLLKKNPLLLDDRVHRALNILRSAHLLGVDEAMKYLSRVRLGIFLERITDIDPALINKLFLLLQPGHLSPEDETVGTEKLRARRATIVRQALRTNEK